ncbi:hypothetical protein JGB31_23985 [Salmonella enterica subsp. enterica serovar Typhimurium]|nr:hypothetical protein [Salmonella enterica subsp. enterica serovar Typhimurium]
MSDPNDLDGFSDATGGKVLVVKDFVGPIMAAEERADRRHLRWSKTGVTFAMTVVVALMNWMVIDMLGTVVQQEMHMISMGVLPAENRTVTTDVYLALIAGTAAEVSALFFIIVKSMFKSSNEPKDTAVTESTST